MRGIVSSEGKFRCNTPAVPLSEMHLNLLFIATTVDLQLSGLKTFQERCDVQCHFCEPDRFHLIKY